MLELVLCLFVCLFMPAQSTLNEKFEEGFDPFFQDFPTKRNDNPYDTIVSSWRTGMPAFHMFAESPSSMKAPKIQVLCNRSKLILLVDKHLDDVLLSGNDFHLGDGCYSNGYLENQFVFTYDFTQCGTNRLVQNGFYIFTNFLHFNPRELPLSWWLSPVRIPVSCMPNRVDDWNFAIKAMNSFWTHTAESNVYQRGETIQLQVTGNPGPSQLPFVQSCFVSESPDPHSRPRHAVINNKGCTATWGANAITQFVASGRNDAVNFLLNTSHLNSEVYIHCIVLISEQYITPAFKYCNFNRIKSRWEDLSGNVNVCNCCSSRCRTSRKHLHVASKTIVTTGPFILVEKDNHINPLPLVHDTPQADSMQADDSVGQYQTSLSVQSGAPSTAPLAGILSGALFSDVQEDENPYTRLSTESVLILGQSPSLALLLPGEVQALDTDLGEAAVSTLGSTPAESFVTNMLPNDSPTPLIPLNPPTSRIYKNEVDNESLFLNLPLVNGWPLAAGMEEAALEESQRKRRGRRFKMTKSMPQEGALALPCGSMMDDIILHEDEKDELAQEHAYAVEDGLKPAVHSKLQFSKGMDGSQTLIYEEVAHPDERYFMMTKAKKRNPDMGQKRLLSTFLDLLRYPL